MNRLRTPLTDKLGISYPIIQAPMAGGVATPELIAAVSNAGGLGSLGAGYLEPADLRAAIGRIRELTTKPFAVNLFIPELATGVDRERIARAHETLAPFRRELGLAPDLPLPETFAPNYLEQLAVILEEAPAVFSFTFGVPRPEELEALKDRGILTMGTATHLLEAIILEESNVDMVVAQGLEAGGHRGTFVGNPEQGQVGSTVLLPLLAAHLRIPVIAAGGIMDGRGVRSALTLGAVGAQMGTAFLACPESGAHPRYKELLCQGTEISTVLTRAFTGRLARGLKNRFIEEMQGREAAIAAYPVQHVLTGDIRRAAADQNRPEFMALWAGQGCPLCRTLPAAELMAAWVKQMETVR